MPSYHDHRTLTETCTDRCGEYDFAPNWWRSSVGVNQRAQDAKRLGPPKVPT